MRRNTPYSTDRPVHLRRRRRAAALKGAPRSKGPRATRKHTDKTHRPRQGLQTARQTWTGTCVMMQEERLRAQPAHLRLQQAATDAMRNCGPRFAASDATRRIRCNKQHQTRHAASDAISRTRCNKPHQTRHAAPDATRGCAPQHALQHRPARPTAHAQARRRAHRGPETAISLSYAQTYKTRHTDTDNGCRQPDRHGQARA